MIWDIFATFLSLATKYDNLQHFISKSLIKNSLYSIFGGTPDTSLCHPCMPRHPGWKSLIYNNKYKASNITVKCKTSKIEVNSNAQFRYKYKYLPGILLSLTYSPKN
jgi:hypothetical protein